VGEATGSEGVNRKGKHISREDATDTRAGWAGQVLSACGRRRGQWAGPKQEKMISELKIGFLNLPRLWKFVEGDLGGILTWGFFLNSSRLLKDFRKI
jgi:hypothetical protein